MSQVIDPARGSDPRVDYRALSELAPWDDRNYALALDDVRLLSDDESLIESQIPLFYRVLLRKRNPELSAPGVRYPRSALQKFRQVYGGFLQDGQFFNDVEWRNGRIRVRRRGGGSGGGSRGDFQGKSGVLNEVRVTSPTGAAESAVAIHPYRPDTVIAGTNGPGGGQKMHYSTDGGATWNSSAALPGASTCCDPTVAWSFDGTKAYTATLGLVGSLYFYRSDDYGVTWNGLETETPGQPSRALGDVNTDKEYIHADTYPGSPYRDNVYVTWHSNNRMRFSKSSDFGNTWSATISFSNNRTKKGIGSDITTDKSGYIYYVWPAHISQKIWLRKSTDGGASFEAATEIATTMGSFDFAIPSMDSRKVFIYVSADVDLSPGPYGGSIYAAWTDATAPTLSNPTGNHARIQVAYSRDGGTSWSITTPHETADAETVDRWHQWLDVAPNGDVHIIFYDTRNDATRTSVDLYHSVSTDGGQSWSTPDRVSSSLSPNIVDSFEFGDYNGMDVVMNRLISIWTDNRDETASATESVDVYSGSGEESVGVFLTARALLQGGFSAGAMSTVLNDGGLIPVIQPYGAGAYLSSPLAYEGTESGVSVDSAGVDWVLVSLRTGTGSASTVATRAALITEDGAITEFDGSRPVSFPGAPKSSLYVVVAHRNHIPIMSATAVDFSSGDGSYDFTTAMNQAYSNAGLPMVDLGGGKFGMFGGDLNHDGQVTAIDFNAWLVATKAAMSGYLDEDFTLDSLVTVPDFNLFLVNTKSVAHSQVPE
ncbi:MAG: sialidase family protein [Rhodothermia bacterium]